MSALTQLAGEGRSKEAFLQAMRDATTGMTKLCGPSAPASVYVTLQQVGSSNSSESVSHPRYQPSACSVAVVGSGSIAVRKHASESA